MKNLIWALLFALAAFLPGLVYAAPNVRYEINGGEVYDKDQNLTWQRCSIGQKWQEGTGCTGIIKTFTFQDAQRQAEGNWRVPTGEELAGLIDRGRQNFPTIDIEAFPDMNIDIPTYWSSTPSDSNRSLDVRFTNGNVTDDINERRYAVRLVRNGK
jgi:hypothetical protein